MTLETRVQSQTQNILFDASLPNTQHYKVGIKGKVDQSKERNSVFSYTSVKKLIERKP